MFKEEGLIEDEDDADTKNVEANVKTEEIIGRTETENGEDLGEPVFINRPKFRMRTGKCIKYTIRFTNFIIFHLGYANKRRTVKRYQCEICKKEFLHLGRYELHKKSHKVKYVCQESVCNVESKDKAVVDQHQSEMGHSGISVVEMVKSAVRTHII